MYVYITSIYTTTQLSTRELCKSFVAVLGEDALTMKLDPLKTKRLVTNTHDQSIRCLRCDGQTRRECVDSSDKRVVSNSLNLVCNLAGDTECIVVDRIGLPLHDLPTHCDCALHTPRRSPDGQETHRGSASVQQIVGSHPHWHLPHSVLLVLVISQYVGSSSSESLQSSLCRSAPLQFFPPNSAMCCTILQVKESRMLIINTFAPLLLHSVHFSHTFFFVCHHPLLHFLFVVL
jgi:hypothetical protein